MTTSYEYQPVEQDEPRGIVPVIDIGAYRSGDAAARDRVVHEVRDACRNVGFFVIQGHGVSVDLVRSMRRVSTEFFDLPREVKDRYLSDPGRTMGYVPMGRESLASTRGQQRPPDVKEIFDICRPDTPESAYYTSEMGQRFFRPYQWPDQPTEFREVWTDYYRQLEQLAATVMEVFALALDLPVDYFADKTNRSVDYLRVIDYPAQNTAPEPGQLRAGEHTDYGTVTFVSTDESPGGLQVQTKSGGWAAVPHVPDSFVVNIGDMMAQWTNDQWVSTVHRVVNPDTGSAGTARRMSVVFFQNPNYDAVIEPLPTCVSDAEPARYQAIHAGDWLLAKTGQQRVS